MNDAFTDCAHVRCWLTGGRYVVTFSAEFPTPLSPRQRTTFKSVDAISSIWAERLSNYKGGVVQRAVQTYTAAPAPPPLPPRPNAVLRPPPADTKPLPPAALVVTK